MELSLEQRRRAGLFETARTLILAGPAVTEVAAAAASVLTAVLGGGCVIRLASEDREWLDVAAVCFADPEHQAFVEMLIRDAGPQPATAGVNGSVFSSGRTLFMGEIDVEEYRLLLQPAFWPVLERYSVASTIAVPLRGSAEILGTLTVAQFDTPVGYDDPCRDFVEQLAGMVAFAVDQARRAERGDADVRVRRVTAFFETATERRSLAWTNGRTHCSDPDIRQALLQLIPANNWDTALTKPEDALDVFIGAFAILGHTPQLRLG